MSLALNQNIVSMGQLFVNATLSANTVTSLVAPALNLHGLVIRTLILSLNASGAGQGINIFADTSAPANVGDFSKRVVMNISESNTCDEAILPYELYLYPGVGLWAGGPAGDMGVFMTYDLLNPGQGV